MAEKKKCLLPTCSSSGTFKVLRLKGVKRLIECAKERNDSETYNILQAILNSQREDVSVELHKSCYCSFTSMDHIKKLAGRKRKSESIVSSEPSSSRIRRSQVREFDFKTQCLFCSKTCEPINPKHPTRWDRVVQCERKGIKGAPPFKEFVLKCCDERNDSWSREVAISCHGVHDLAAAEAQYHVRCYDSSGKYLPPNVSKV